jgi:hypothetical protein
MPLSLVVILADQKFAALRFFINRLKTYILQDKAIKKEITYIHNILNNNAFPLQWINKLMEKPSKDVNDPQEPLEKKRKCITFSFLGKATYISKIFRNAKIGITYKTEYSITEVLKSKPSAVDENESLHSGCISGHVEILVRNVWGRQVDVLKLGTESMYGPLKTVVPVLLLRNIC